MFEIRFPDPTNEAAFIVPETFALPAKRLVTFSIDRTFRVPTLALWANRVVRFDVPVRFALPETVRPLRVPTDVMFGWALPETTRATVAFWTFPETLDPWIFERVLPKTAMFERSPPSPRKNVAETFPGSMVDPLGFNFQL